VSQDKGGAPGKGFDGLQSLSSKGTAKSDTQNPPPLPSQVPPARTVEAASRPSLPVSQTKPTNTTGIVVVSLIAVVIVIAVIDSMSGSTSRSRTPPLYTPSAVARTPPPAPVFSAPAQPLPQTGALSGSSGYSENFIEIQTRADGTHTLVKIEDLYGNVVSEGFIRDGGGLRLYVPLGTYVMKTASGTTWFGRDHLFGPDTQYSKPDDTFPLSERGEYWTVELIPQTGGNMQDRRISASEF